MIPSLLTCWIIGGCLALAQPQANGIPIIPLGAEVKIELDGYASYYEVIGFIKEDGHLFNHYRVICRLKNPDGTVESQYKTVMPQRALEAYYKR